MKRSWRTILVANMTILTKILNKFIVKRVQHAMIFCVWKIFYDLHWFILKFLAFVVMLATFRSVSWPFIFRNVYPCTPSPHEGLLLVLLEWFENQKCNFFLICIQKWRQFRNRKYNSTFLESIFLGSCDKRFLYIILFELQIILQPAYS